MIAVGNAVVRIIAVIRFSIIIVDDSYTSRASLNREFGDGRPGPDKSGPPVSSFFRGSCVKSSRDGSDPNLRRRPLGGRKPQIQEGLNFSSAPGTGWFLIQERTRPARSFRGRTPRRRL